MPPKTPLIPISLIIIILLFIPILSTAQTSDNGLVAEWHFDEGKGNIVKDTSGNGNDGTIYGATWVDGKDDYISVPDDPQLDVNRFSVSLWFNSASDQGGFLILKGEECEELIKNAQDLLVDGTLQSTEKIGDLTPRDRKPLEIPIEPKGKQRVDIVANLKYKDLLGKEYKYKLVGRLNQIPVQDVAL